MTVLQYEILSEITRTRSTWQQVSKRIQILLLGSEGHSNADISRKLGIAVNTVRAWRERWSSGYESLEKFEGLMAANDVKQSDYREELLATVKDLPRSGAPKVFTLAQEKSIIALACEEPAKHGIEMTVWTHEMLVKVAIAKKIVSTISVSQVHRILKK